MSPALQAFWARATRRASGMEPDTLASILRAFANLQANMSEPEMTRLIQSGSLDQLVAAIVNQAQLDRAVMPVRQRLRQNMAQAFRYVTADLPNSGKVDGVLAVAFDHLNPRVIDAVRGMEGPVVASIQSDAIDMVRAYWENGLRDGTPPRQTARYIRAAVGLGESQVQQVENFRDALRGLNGRSLSDYALRNQRLDAMLAKGPLTEEQVERYTDQYRSARIAQNARVVSKTATLNSYRVGQKLSWQDAQEKGVIPAGYVLKKRWVHLAGQLDPRPEHLLMDGQTVLADQDYSNGDSTAGAGDPWNCHCMDRFFVDKAA